jgi:L-alanine-DL-glutamate epimerase-like enolase superfamily enzyme
MADRERLMKDTVIEEVLATPLNLPLTEPFSIATGAQQSAENVLVRLRLSDGTVGLGEAAPFPAVSGETQQSSMATIERAADLLSGLDAREWGRIDALLAEKYPDEPAARCAVETAVLDALLRHHHMPLWSFFGGASSSLETDMTVTAGDCTHASLSARAVLAHNINIIKVKLGALSPMEDAERLKAVCTVAPKARIIADANGGYTLAKALLLLEEVEKAGIPLEFLEQPLPREDLDGMAYLTEHCPATICADESARSAADVLELVKRKAVGAINIKIMKCGVVEAIRMWSIAHTAGLKLMIGGMVESILAMTFSAHFAVGFGGFDYVDLDTPIFITSHPFTGGFCREGGILTLHHICEGHGVELKDGSGM